MEFLNARKVRPCEDVPLLPQKRRKRHLAVSPSNLSKNINVADYLSAIRSLPQYEEGRLRRIGALGSGTSFQVQKADDQETGTVVIVKTPHDLVQNTQETSTKVINNAILQELKISTHVPFKRHRNITQTLGFELISIVNMEPVLSLVVEFAEKGSLSHYFEKSKLPASCSDWEQRTSFAIDVASALEALHSCRVVHGDIKPDNVLIFRNEADGPPLKAKLSDFGSAIVEDTVFPGKQNIAPQAYHGTLIYVPPIVRQASMLPFHILPACDVFSFGLLLWSISKGRSYYESSWKPAGQSDREFLDNIGVDGLIQRFQAYFSDEKNSIPVNERRLLKNAFLGCIVDISCDSSPQLAPSVRDRVLKTAFSKIGQIKSMLMAETDHKQFVAPILPNTNDADGSGERSEFSHSYLYPFRMDHYVIDGTNQIQWQMQCQLRQHFLNTIEDPSHSAFQKCNIALRLSVYSAVGIGCKKDLDEALDYLLTAAAFKNASAQLICHRVFEAHARASPVLQPDLLPACSVIDSDESEGSSSDFDMEDTDDWQSDNGDEKMENNLLTPDENGDEEPQIGSSTNETEDMVSFASELESDLDHSLFHLSAAMDQAFKRMVSNGEISSSAYYSWKIRRFERAHSEANSVAKIHSSGKEYSGIEELSIADLCYHWTLEKILPTIEVKVQDGSLLEEPLLHYAIACCNQNIVRTLLKLGISPQTQDDSGNTALHIACKHGYKDITKLLVRLGAKATVGNQAGSLPLHWLWMFDDSDVEEMAELLVSNADANVNASMRASESTVDAFFPYSICGTPLHSAISVRNAKAVQVLIDQGADVNVRPLDNGETPLELAAMLHLSNIAEILLRHGANIRDERNDGTWVLHHVGRHVEPLKRWLLHGPEYRDAASHIIQALVNAAKLAELDPESRDENGQTAFECSIQEPGEDDYVVEAFLKNGFSLPSDALELAIYSCARNQENASKVELVLKSNASLDSTNPDGRNVLHTCAVLRAARAAQVILNHPVGVRFLNAQEIYGDTPLHCTVDEDEVATAKVLIEAGATIDTVDHDHMSALANAITEKSTQVASYLLQQNADIWLRGRDWMGCSILVLAVTVDLDSSNPMLPYLLSTDLIDDDDDDDNDDDSDVADKRRFPQLHDLAVLNAVETQHGNTALHRAASLADHAGVVALISARASAEIRNSAGRTARQEAETQLHRVQAAEEEGREERMLRAENLRKIIGFLR